MYVEISSNGIYRFYGIVFFCARRYNENDLPVCRVCDVVLKSDSLWLAHQASRKHHEVIFYCPTKPRTVLRA